MSTYYENGFVSSFDIANELGTRHDNVKMKIRRYKKAGLIGFFEQARVYLTAKPTIIYKLTPKDAKTICEVKRRRKKIKAKIIKAPIQKPVENIVQEKLEFVADEKIKTSRIKPSNEYKRISIPFTEEGYKDLVKAGAKAERRITQFIKRAIQKAIDEELGRKVKVALPIKKCIEKELDKAPKRVGFFKALLLKI